MIIQSPHFWIPWGSSILALLTKQGDGRGQGTGRNLPSVPQTHLRVLQSRTLLEFPPLPSSTSPPPLSSSASPVIGVIVGNRSSFAEVVGRSGSPVLPLAQQGAVERNAPSPLNISDHYASTAHIFSNSPLPCRAVEDLPPAPGTQRNQELGEEAAIARTSSDILVATSSNDVSPPVAHTLPWTNVAVVVDSHFECIFSFGRFVTEWGGGCAARRRFQTAIG